MISIKRHPHPENSNLPCFQDRLGERITYHVDENSVEGIISYLSIYAYYGDLDGDPVMPCNLIAFIHVSYLEKAARIDDIHVAPQFRNRGIATQILKIAMETASRNGHCRMIGILSNKPGFKGFFIKQGYSAHEFNSQRIYLFHDREPLSPEQFYISPWAKFIQQIADFK